MEILKRITYKNLEEALKNRTAFTCSSIQAYTKCTDVASLYLVWSYRTVIAVYDYNKQEWYLNEEYYSNTTTKLQNAVKSAVETWRGYIKEADFNEALGIQ